MQNFQGAGLAIGNCPARSPEYCISIIRGSRIGSIRHLRTVKAEGAKANKKCSKGTWSVTRSIRSVTRAAEGTDAG